MKERLISENRLNNGRREGILKNNSNRQIVSEHSIDCKKLAYKPHPAIFESDQATSITIPISERKHDPC